MVYAATLSESQRVMRLQIIIKEFEPNIQQLAGVDNIVADTIIRLPYISVNKCETTTMKY